MPIEYNLPSELRLFLNHIYELKKGVRNMVLYTLKKEYTEYAVQRLKNQHISYLEQEVDDRKVNLYFGKQECMNAMRHIINSPLNNLTPEEDFILGAMLGYDICMQCDRYCGRKNNVSSLSMVYEDAG